MNRAEVDEELADWISRRERNRHRVGQAGLVVAVLSGLLVLMSDRYLLTPGLPLAGALVWWASAWISDGWYTLRSGLAGHPVVRAELSWSIAAHRIAPLGWYEAPVRGSLHRTARGWIWRPSSLVAVDLPVLGWRDDDVVASTITPLWGPVLPESAQLRLYVRGGGSVEFIVWHPHRLLPTGLVGSALTS